MALKGAVCEPMLWDVSRNLFNNAELSVKIPQTGQLAEVRNARQKQIGHASICALLVISPSQQD